MLREKEKKILHDLDDIAEKAGGYVDYVPGRPLIIDADYRAMSKYCRERGITSFDLTDEEYAMFVYDPPLVYGGAEDTIILEK